MGTITDFSLKAISDFTFGDHHRSEPTQNTRAAKGAAAARDEVGDLPGRVSIRMNQRAPS
jgi:hypothetical protein